MSSGSIWENHGISVGADAEFELTQFLFKALALVKEMDDSGFSSEAVVKAVVDEALFIHNELPHRTQGFKRCYKQSIPEKFHSQLEII